jgi:hypothetical protein
MFKALFLFMLSLSLVGCASAPVADSTDAKSAETTVAPETKKEETAKEEPKLDAASQKLSDAYEVLSFYKHDVARQLIDDAIKIQKDSGNFEGLGTAYTVSADYYRFVEHDLYKKGLEQLKKDPNLQVEPIRLYMVLGPTKSENVKREVKLAVDAYNKAIAADVGSKKHYNASENYYRLAVIHMRSSQTNDACKALDDALAQYVLGRKVDPDFNMNWNKMRYPSYPDQIVDIKKKSGCAQPVLTP